MTLLVVLMFGFGAVLIISAIETDPKTGKSVSITQTINDIWNNTVDFSQPAESGGNAGGGQTANSGGGGGGGGSFILQPPGSPLNPPPPGGGPGLGTAAGPDAADAYRQGVVRAWLRSQSKPQ